MAFAMTGVALPADADKATKQTPTPSYVNTLRQSIQTYWAAPPDIEKYPDIVVRIKFRLKPDGGIDGLPSVTGRGGTPDLLKSVKLSAVRAVLRAAPFKLPRDKYADWKNVDMIFGTGGL
jgi:hypothetical protein